MKAHLYQETHTQDFLIKGNKKMARMHSRDKGKSRSTKPIAKKVPSWVSYKTKEVEKLVVKLSKEDGSICSAAIYKHRSLPQARTTYFEIKNSGLIEAKKPKKRFKLFLF